MSEPDVFIGTNTIILNSETVIKLLNDWLHVNVSGGPYKVTGWDFNDDNCIEFGFHPVVQQGLAAKG